VHISAKWNDVNTRKGEAKERAASQQGKERNAIAGVAAYAVGAITSLLLLIIMYTDTYNDGHNLMQCSLHSHLAKIIMMWSVYLAHSSRSWVADAKPFCSLATKICTTRCSTIQHYVTNDNVVFRLETFRQTLGRVDNELTTTQALSDRQMNIYIDM